MFKISFVLSQGTSLAAGRNESQSRYPVGRKRFEPLGVLIFSVCMIASFSQVSQVLARISKR